MENSKKFLGHVKMKISRQHLSIPLVYANLVRELADKRLFITLGDRRLLVFPIDSWFAYENRLNDYQNKQYRKQLHRQSLFGTTPSELDSSGRIKLSANLFSFMGEPAEVMVVGKGDHMQVYTLSEFKRHEDEMNNDPVGIVAEEDMDYVKEIS